MRAVILALLVCLAVGDYRKMSPQSKTHVETETLNLLEELVVDGEGDGLLLSPGDELACDVSCASLIWVISCRAVMNGTLIKSGDDLCLDTSQPFVEGSALHMWLCDDNNVREQWDYNPTTKQVV